MFLRKAGHKTHTDDNRLATFKKYKCSGWNDFKLQFVLVQLKKLIAQRVVLNKMVSKQLFVLLLAAVLMMQYSMTSGTILEELGKLEFKKRYYKIRDQFKLYHSCSVLIFTVLHCFSTVYILFCTGQHFNTIQFTLFKIYEAILSSIDGLFLYCPILFNAVLYIGQINAVPCVSTLFLHRSILFQCICRIKALLCGRRALPCS